MKHYQVNITHKALADMDAIYHYIAATLHAPDAAMKQYERIAAEIQSLALFPQRCRLLETQPERNMGLRQLLVDRYCAIYVVDDSTVTVLRVLYSASSVADRLKRS